MILADVAAVADDTVTLRVLPTLSVEVDRAEVTSNPKDLLRELFTVQEVVVCRLVQLDPPRLQLDDIDDADEPRTAPSLLADGPPWLPQPAAEPPRVTHPFPAGPPTLVGGPPALAPEQPATPATSATSTSTASTVEPAEARRPSPLDLARRSGAAAAGTAGTPGTPSAPAAAAPAPARPAAARPAEVVSAQQLQQLTELTNELAAERRTRQALSREMQALSAELQVLRDQAAQLEARLTAETENRTTMQTRYRSADLARQKAVRELRSATARADQAAEPELAAFADRVAQFRFEVYLEWVHRIPAADKASKPLAEYTLADDFLDSVEQLAGVSRAKIVSVVVEVLTDQVAGLAGRELHQLRSGPAGSPYLTRPDGATCWRVALQRDTASARRLHYWRTRGGYELSRVVLHDDFRP